MSSLQTRMGIHHISIISGDGQTNAEFYVHKLGLKLVMKTVNQDDPGRYHLFYTNGQGSPGSSITFFPWPMARDGMPGTGEAVAVSFSVPTESQPYWLDRFEELGIDHDELLERFGRSVLPFQDPDGLNLELVFDDRCLPVDAWERSDVPAEHGIRGFWGSTLKISDRAHGPTAELLTEVFGFEQKKTEGELTLYETDSPIGNAIIIEEDHNPEYGANGRGIVHHVAFRANDDEEHQRMRKQVQEFGLQPTEVIDRHFFKSVYFRSPGGVLFEIATDGPGYESTMPKEELGKKLFLPPWLESKREAIEQNLEPIEI
ncbi:MAG: ring-cleaving dioxygenase [Bacteroidota bacterium]